MLWTGLVAVVLSGAFCFWVIKKHLKQEQLGNGDIAY
jgi:hypothetical protein